MQLPIFEEVLGEFPHPITAHGIHLSPDFDRLFYLLFGYPQLLRLFKMMAKAWLTSTCNGCCDGGQLFHFWIYRITFQSSFSHSGSSTYNLLMLINSI